MLHRRHLLWGLAASACVPRARPVDPTVNAAKAQTGERIRLGWRWVPGMALTYRTEVSRVRGGLEVRTADEWRYVALQLDANGVMTIDGTLEASGVLALRDGRRVDDPVMDAAFDKEQPQEEVQLAMRLTGRIVSCSQTQVAAALPHRMLGFQLPTEPVRSDESWSDSPFMLPFSRLVGGGLPLTAHALTTLARIEDRRAGGWQAELQHTGTLKGGEGSPIIHVVGRSLWHTDPGLLHSRTLTARMDPDHHGTVGVLTVTTKLVREETPRR